LWKDGFFVEGSCRFGWEGVVDRGISTVGELCSALMLLKLKSVVWWERFVDCDGYLTKLLRVGVEGERRLLVM